MRSGSLASLARYSCAASRTARLRHRGEDCGLGRNREPELATAACAGQIDDRAAVAPCDRSRFVESQPDSRGFSGHRIAALFERGERTVDVVLGQARSSIQDGERYAGDGASRTPQDTRGHVKLNGLLFWTELQRVVEEVRQRSGQTRRVRRK